MKETDPRFVNLRKKIILFFIAALTGIITTIVFIGIERGTFIPKYRISFTVDKGTGLFEGMPVKLSGFKIGKIENLSLDESAKVKVGLLINKKYQKWIRQDSHAVLTKEGVIGESVIDVTVGALDNPTIEDGGVIQYEKIRGIEVLVEDIRPILGEIRDVLAYINDPNADIRQTLANLKILSIELLITRENMDKLLKNTNSNISKVSADISSVVKNIDSLVYDVDKTVIGIDEKIVPIIDKLDKTMDNAEKTTAALKDTMEQSSPKIQTILDKGEEALNETNEVIRSVKQVWPISLFIEEPKEDILYGDSYE